MRVLLASDLHYQLRQYDWLIQAAQGFDAVIIAGDHLDIASAVPGEVQIAALRASFAAIADRAPLLVCSGNHDLNARSLAGEKTADWLDALRSPRLSVDGDSASIGGTLFTVCPWWDGPDARARVERLLDEAALHRRGGDWVWVYHAPPLGPLSWTGKRHFGDPLLPALIERHAPTAVLCGHIHEAPFRRDGGWIERIGETWVFNPGRQPGTVPAHIEIDLAARRARWITLEGIEERSLL
ncbi:MAG: metallophosphoesterase family protein [Panacagrimonas sp.]